MLCFVKPVLQRFLSYVLISRTNAHAVRGRPTLNDVERFRNGPVHELSSLKASQMCKVYTSSHEITNEPYMSSNQNTGKTLTADLKTNYYAEMNTSLAEKIKNVGEHNGKISAQPHTTLCIQFLDRKNNDKNRRLPLGKQICFTIVWGCAEILPTQLRRWR